jgi:hypothetical protein
MGAAELLVFGGNQEARIYPFFLVDNVAHTHEYIVFEFVNNRRNDSINRHCPIGPSSAFPERRHEPDTHPPPFLHDDKVSIARQQLKRGRG